jgi:hydroxymethylglutaryl-CoA lyase
VTNGLPRTVSVTEVGPRDGLQSHSSFVATDVKVAMVDRLSATGLRTIEATSFAHPDVVPHLRDAEHVLASIHRRPGVVYRALAPNARGAQRAVDAGADAVLGLVTASETYNRENQNRTIAESVDEAARAYDVATSAGLGFTMAVGMALYCPFEGPIDPECVLAIVESLYETGVRSFYFAGSQGVEDPRHVGHLVGAATTTWPDSQFGFHVHDLSGFGLVNAYAAVCAGATFLESSICGLGGGMHVPSGSSNVATEDLVHLLAACAVATGLDPSEIVSAAQDVADLLGIRPRSRVTMSGVRSDLVGAALADAPTTRERNP